MRRLAAILFLSLSALPAARALVSASVSAPSPVNVNQNYTVNSSGSDDAGTLDDLIVTKNGQYLDSAYTQSWMDGSNFNLSLSDTVTAPGSAGTTTFVATVDTDTYTTTASTTVTVVVPNTAPIGAFDGVSTPSIYQNQNVAGSGWAADNEMGSPVDHVDIQLDGSHVVNATLGGSRPDVASVYNRSDYTNSGWSFSYDVGALAVGSHTVTAIAWDNQGASTSLGSKSFTVAGRPTGAITSSLGATVYVGQTTAISATYAADTADGDSLTQTALALNGTAVQSGSPQNYSYNWSPPAPGSYTFTGTVETGIEPSTWQQTASFTITVPDRPPVTAPLTAPSTTICNQPITITVTDTDPDNNLINQAIDYLAPGSSTWVSGWTSGANWSGAPTGSHTLTYTFPGSLTAGSPGVWQFRERGGDGSQVAAFQYASVTVNARTPTGTQSITGGKAIPDGSIGIVAGTVLTLNSTATEPDYLTSDWINSWWWDQGNGSQWTHPAVAWDYPANATGWSNYRSSLYAASSPTDTLTENWTSNTPGIYAFLANATAYGNIGALQYQVSVHVVNNPANTLALTSADGGSATGGQSLTVPYGANLSFSATATAAGGYLNEQGVYYYTNPDGSGWSPTMGGTQYQLWLAGTAAATTSTETAAWTPGALGTYYFYTESFTGPGGLSGGGRVGIDSGFPGWNNNPNDRITVTVGKAMPQQTAGSFPSKTVSGVMFYGLNTSPPQSDLNASFYNPYSSSVTAPSGTITYEITGATGAGASPTSGAVTNGTVLQPGIYTIQASYPGDANYAPATATATYTIVQDIPPTVQSFTITGSTASFGNNGTDYNGVASQIAARQGDTLTLTSVINAPGASLTSHGFWWDQGSGKYWTNPEVTWDSYPANGTGWSNITPDQLNVSSPTTSTKTANWSAATVGTYQFQTGGTDAANQTTSAQLTVVVMPNPANTLTLNGTAGNISLDYGQTLTVATTASSPSGYLSTHSLDMSVNGGPWSYQAGGTAPPGGYSFVLGANAAATTDTRTPSWIPAPGSYAFYSEAGTSLYTTYPYNVVGYVYVGNYTATVNPGTPELQSGTFTGAEVVSSAYALQASDLNACFINRDNTTQTTAPTGTVTYTIINATGSGASPTSGTVSVNTVLTPGVYTIQANYPGDANYTTTTATMTLKVLDPNATPFNDGVTNAQKAALGMNLDQAAGDGASQINLKVNTPQ